VIFIKRYSFVFFVVYHYFFSQLVRAQLLPNEGLNPEQVEFIYGKLKDFPIGTQSAIAIIKDGKAQFTGTIKTNEDTLIFFDNRDKVFEIGSITKVFTSTMLASLVLEGKLSLNDPIQNYLKIKLHDDPGITFLSLANHTSGLPPLPPNFATIRMLNPDNPYKAYAEDKLIHYLTKDLKVVEGVGVKINYSNLGAALLGYVLTKVSGNDYQGMLEKYITNELQLRNTTTVRSQVQDKLVQGINYDGKVAENWDMNVFAGAGAILSSAEDLSQFAIKQLYSPSDAMKLTQKITHKDSESTSIGLGWFILKNGSTGHQSLFHNGGTGGYTGSIVLDMDAKQGVVVLTNISAYHQGNRKVDELSFGLLKSLEAE
jgi:CubicO group peptidase (beta-lactamase class C family)